MKVVCVSCKKCGRLATKDLKWVAADNGTEEILLCVCGGKEWEFVRRDSSGLLPNILVINNAAKIEIKEEKTKT